MTRVMAVQLCNTEIQLRIAPLKEVQEVIKWLENSKSLFSRKNQLTFAPWKQNTTIKTKIWGDNW